MKHDDLAPDPELARALHRFDSVPEHSLADLHTLTRDIVAGAAPILDARGHRTTPWWEYAAAWSRTLIPIGVTTALVAAGFIIWATRTSAAAAERANEIARANTGTDAFASQALINTLVAPVELDIVPVSASARR